LYDELDGKESKKYEAESGVLEDEAWRLYMRAQSKQRE
jgi:hypothetical protein